jgi:hypothetical protein
MYISMKGSKGKCSEVFYVSNLVSADGASECVFLSIGRMLYLERAGVCARAPGQLVLGVAGHIVAVDLPLVARLAEVSVAPAEPLSDRATEFTLELDIVSAVLLAVNYTCSYLASGALTTDQLFWFILLTLLLCT